jgi:hypothetical protein
MTLEPFQTFMGFAEKIIVAVNGEDVFAFFTNLEFNAKLDPLPFFNFSFEVGTTIFGLTRTIGIGGSLFVDAMVLPSVYIPIPVPGATLDFFVGAIHTDMGKADLSFHFNPNPFSLTDRSYTGKVGIDVTIEKHAGGGGKVGFDTGLFISIDDKTVRKSAEGIVSGTVDVMNKAMKNELTYEGIVNGIDRYTVTYPEIPIDEFSDTSLGCVYTLMHYLFALAQGQIWLDFDRVIDDLGISGDVEIGISASPQFGVGLGIPELANADLIVTPTYN